MPPNAPGVVVEQEGALRFVPAELALAVVQRPPVSPVPGTRVGLSLVGGRVLPVLALGSLHAELLVCEVNGVEVALDGLRVVDSGFFTVEGGQVAYQGQPVPALDVQGELERIQKESWGLRGPSSRE